MDYELLEIKQECNLQKLKKCRICLSVNRKLSPVGHLSAIYINLLPTYSFQEAHSSTLICWECKATLRKFMEFQKKVSIAESLLLYATENENPQTTLSSLTSIVITEDSHIEVTQSNKTIQEVEEAKLENEHFSDNEVSESIEVKNEVKLETISSKIIYENIWRKKRAKINKKAVRIVDTSKTKNGFNKVLIDQQALMEALENKRHSHEFINELYKCGSCVISFGTEKGLARHERLHHDESIGSLICNVCQARFSNKHLLASHFKRHLFRYECAHCQYNCFNHYSIQQHVKRRHGKIYECVKCGCQFWKRVDFSKHHKDMHENYVCDYCGLCFKMRYCIKKHIRKKHCSLECKQCKRIFSRYNGLWLHRKLKHPAHKLEKAYCVECNKQFDNIYCYKWHLNNSVRHKPKKKISVPCPGCDKVFSKNIYMKNHYDLVHLKMFKYRCEQCDKNFVRNADLVKHTRRVHEGQQKPKNKICYMCGRGFSSNSILANHMRTHTGERPFQCQYCAARFAQKVAMMGHVRNIHLKQKKINITNTNNYIS